jgi:type II secretory pathway predicted ATPase ExeA/LysM repeat protein
MYTKHFGLRAKPFGLSPDPRSFYESTQHGPVLAAALSTVEEGRGMVVLTGPAGVGKTALVRKLLGRLPPEIDAMFLQYTNLDLDGLLTLLIEELGLEHLGGPRLEQFEVLRRGLADRSDCGEPVLLLVDEAQNLCAEALTVLLRLVRESREEGSSVQLVLVGQPELEDAVRASATGRIHGAISEWLRLENMRSQDVEPMIRYRLQVAGSQRDDLFQPEAIASLYHYTGGNPRLLNLLCDHALMHAYKQGATSVGTDMVDLAATERRDGAGAEDLGTTEDTEMAKSDPSLGELVRGAFEKVVQLLKQPLGDIYPRRRARSGATTVKKGRGSWPPAADWIPMAALGGGVVLLVLVLLAPTPDIAADEEEVALLLPLSDTPPESATAPKSELLAVPEVVAAPEVIDGEQPREIAIGDTGVAAEAGALEEMNVADMRAQLVDLHNALNRALSEREALARDLAMLRGERDALLARMAAERTPQAIPVSTRSSKPRETNKVSLISAPSVAAESPDAASAAPVLATPSLYQASKGDTLWSVARDHELSVPELLALNDFDPGHVLRSGEVLKVVDTSPSTELVSTGWGTLTSQPSQVSQAPQRYTVQRGDTLYGISRRFRVSVGELSHWNGLSDGAPLLAGQRLVVYADS